MKRILHTVIFFIFLCYCNGYRILVMNTTPGKSHAILMDGVVRHLSRAGHKITYITTLPDSIRHQNVSTVDVSANNEFVKGDVLNIRSIMDNKIDMRNLRFLLNILLEVVKSALTNPNVQNLLADADQQFDVIIAEWMYTELTCGIAAVYNCPFIWVSSLDPHWMVLQLIDDLPNPAYYADPISKNIIPFTFIQRSTELINQLYGILLKNLYFYKQEEKYYKEHVIPYIRTMPPSLDELRYNASLILSNSHLAMGTATRLPQNYKYVGGFHIDTEMKELPMNLKKIMDDSSEGVIYFSLGSNLKSTHLPEKLKVGLLRVFGELKQTVLWKFEEHLSNLPYNVHIVDWAPQLSILAHPNCVLFITHGGLLSTTEAIHFGVPLIGIPVFADQFINVDRAVQKGFAKRVDLSYEMENAIKEAIHDVLDNAKYRQRVKELSQIYHSRLVPPGVELVHWVEHVVQTRGAPHLRSPALHMPLYQKYYLDLLAVVLVLLTAVLYVVRKIFKLFSNRLINNKKNN